MAPTWCEKQLAPKCLAPFKKVCSCIHCVLIQLGFFMLISWVMISTLKTAFSFPHRNEWNAATQVYCIVFKQLFLHPLKSRLPGEAFAIPGGIPGWELGHEILNPKKGGENNNIAHKVWTKSKMWTTTSLIWRRILYRLSI